MDMKVLDPMTVYVLIGGVIVIFLGLALRQVETLQKTVPLWLWSGLAGVLLGAVVAAFTVHMVESVRAESQPSTQPGSVPSSLGSMPMGGPMSGGGSQMGGGRGGGPGTGGPGGLGGAPGAPANMGGPGGGGPRARRDLTALIAKLDLLTRGLQINLDAEQKANLTAAIEALDNEDEMTEDAAKEHLDAIQAILTAENAETLASIELPRAARSGAAAGPVSRQGAAARGPMEGAPPSMSPPPPVAAATRGAPPLMGARSTPSNENPFKQEENGKRLKDLRARIAGAN